MKKIATRGGEGLANQPFAGLDIKGVPERPETPAVKTTPAPVKSEKRNRGRLDVRRERRGGGGGQVLVIEGPVLQHLGDLPRAALFKMLKQACAAGGSCGSDRIEIQGDNRDKVMALLVEEGFRPVWSGG
jgi:translation initiation factor 1